jgi:hypothetical protein
VALPFVAAFGWDGFGWDDYSHRSQYISELGADGAPNGAAVSATFFVIGALFVAWAALTARRLAAAIGLTGAAGAVWLAGGGLGLSSAVPAVARCEPGCPDEDVGTAQMVHNLTGSAGYTLAIAALVVFGLVVRRSGTTNDRARKVGRAGIWAAPLLAGIGLATLVGDDWRGLLQRLLEVGLYAWVLAVTALVARTQARVRT